MERHETLYGIKVVLKSPICGILIGEFLFIVHGKNTLSGISDWHQSRFVYCGLKNSTKTNVKKIRFHYWTF